ncbi:MAG: SRPBCC family protein [Verrucomicrobia bacterium]|nr:SRPBCC family protein [Verrucomicrobiota bacterium]
METIEKSIDVNAPIRAVYNQWTQFEEFPRFMDGIDQVQQLDNVRLHWKATVAGKTKEWDSEIVEQTPDKIISWRSIAGASNSGTVRFEAVDANTTKVLLNLNYEPESATEKVGGALGVASGKVEGDLKRFKEFIEQRGAETGGWRGEIHGGKESGADRLKTAAEIATEPRSKRLH